MNFLAEDEGFEASRLFRVRDALIDTSSIPSQETSRVLLFKDETEESQNTGRSILLIDWIFDSKC